MASTGIHIGVNSQRKPQRPKLAGTSALNAVDYGATFAGSVDPRRYPPAVITMEWGTAAKNLNNSEAVGNFGVPGSFSNGITTMPAGTVIYWRLKAVNAVGVSTTDVFSFSTTLAPYTGYLARVAADAGTVLTGSDNTTNYLADQIRTLKNTP